MLNGGHILVYVRDDIPCKLIPMRNYTIEGFFIELKLRKKKTPLFCFHNSHQRFISNHLILLKYRQLFTKYLRKTLVFM